MNKINTLYVIDDDEVFQSLAEIVINSSNLVDQIKTFSNGSDAIQHIASICDQPWQLPELIFLDLFMPIMDGWGFLEKYVAMLPRISKKITIFIVSSSIDPVDVQRAKSISVVSDFVIKPITRAKFLNCVKDLV